MKNFNTKLCKKKWFLLALCMVLALFFLRVLYLDGDPPRNSLLDYSPVDEGIYANLALNLVNYGHLNPNTYFGKQVVETTPQVLIDIIGNLIVYAGLYLFGDNYYGFRLPVVFVAGLICLLIFLNFRQVDKRYAKDTRTKWIALAFLFIITSNFVFYNASRVVEPTIFRMLFAALVLYVFQKLENRNRLRSLLIGMLSTISVFLVYINNSFLFIGFILFILYLLIMKEKKKAWECLCFGAIGSLLCAGAAQLYYMHWGTDIVSNTLEIISSFQDNANYTFVSDENFFRTLLERFADFFASNFFIYTMPLIVGGMVSLRQIGRMFSKKYETVVFCSLQIVALLLQTFVSTDFINRKSIVLLPFFAVLLYEIAVRAVVEGDFAKSRAASVLAFVMVICCFAYKLLHNETGYGEYNLYDIITLVGFFAVPSGAVALLTLSGWKSLKKLIPIYVAIVCAGNMLFTFRYNIRNIHFAERDAMISLQAFDGEYILGEYENGFTLYNDILPVLDTKENILELMKTGEYKYYFDYANVDAFLSATYPHVRLEKHFIVSRDFPNQYGDNDMCVYTFTYLGE